MSNIPHNDALNALIAELNALSAPLAITTEGL